jgi:hypothetical protein
MKNKIDRTVPGWADAVIIVILSGAFAISVKEAKQLEGEPILVAARLLGAFIGLAIAALILHWLLGWCFGLLRAAFTRDKDEYDR